MTIKNIFLDKLNVLVGVGDQIEWRTTPTTVRTGIVKLVRDTHVITTVKYGRRKRILLDDIVSVNHGS